MDQTTDGPPARPRMLDVARAAGVSFQTVSRALNGGPRVSPDTRARVVAAATELGYRPNITARALATGRGSQIAAFVPDTVRFDYSAGLSAIEKDAREAGLSLAITVLADDRPASVREVVDWATAQPLAGAVVFAFDRSGTHAYRALPPSLPTVVIGGPPRRGRAHVTLDEYAGARAATEHLLGLGHRTVHHLSLPDGGHPWRRVVGWRDALEAAGAPVPPRITVGWGSDAAREAARAVAATGATAVQCATDDTALGLMRGLADLGVRVPADVSVVGFDDIPYARVWNPELTTVRQDFWSMGSRAFALLQHRISGGPVRAAEVLPTTLVVRRSTGSPR
jgi:DNA-binding LacI/PurR family transcriptional regulator